MKKALTMIGSVALLAAAGCSSASGHAPTTSSVKAAHFRTTYGMDAAEIAGHVNACANVAAGSGDESIKGVTSTASCTIDHHKVVFYAWDSADDQAPLSSLSKALVYAHGAGWDAVTVDSASDAAQRQIAKAVLADLTGTIQPS